MVIYYQKNA